MDVAVSQKHGQWLRSIPRPSVLGDGLLERARATSIGLLGLTAAVGLAIVALVFNQGWPLVAGGSIPPLPPGHQAVGEATVAEAPVGKSRSGAEAGRTPRRDGVADEKARSDGSPAHSGGTSPAPSSELVVSPSVPVKTGTDGPKGGSGPGQAPVKPKQPPPTPTQPQAPQQTPSSPQPEVAEPKPPATVSEAPTVSNVPPWSNGKGHAYGRDDDDEWDDDHDHGHGHDRDRDRDDD
jgi:hypothetical protein